MDLIILFLMGYVAFFIAGNSPLEKEEFFGATIQLTISFALLLALLFAVRSYPAIWGYNSQKKFVDKLKIFDTH